MAQLYEILKLEEIIRSHRDGGFEETRKPVRWLNDPDTVEVDAWLARFGVSSSDITKSDSRMIVAGRLPWLTILLDREYRIAGHLVSIREHLQDMRFTAWSLPPGHRVETHGVPSVSTIHVSCRQVLRRYAEESPIFVQVWDHVKYCKPSGLWLLRMDPLPEKVLPATDVDDAMFMDHWQSLIR